MREPSTGDQPGSDDMPRLSWSRHGAVHILQVHGDITAASAVDVHDALLTFDPPPGAMALVVDLSTVDTLAVAGVDAMRTDNASLSLHLVATGSVLRSLLLAGLSETTAVHESLDAAVEGIEGIDEATLLREQLHQREQQIASQPVIEQAKGMLMQDFKLDEAEAFDLLTTLSQDTNSKVRDVAAKVVDELTGTASAETAHATLDTLRELRDHLRQG
ncbi:ANTAR domain-containing protein [Actinophytocola sp. NPDC049390]|uniref:ANTAR domain-containing protein n=1 Tax=Actinophytocola sp. NPDC049390 TaxID=3363894 RepID=UPI00379BAA86